MKMKYAMILLSLISFSILYSGVKGQCYFLLPAYYGCKYESTFTYNDTIFQQELSGITTFSAAMELYRAIFTEIHTCSSSFCQCVKQNYLKGQYYNHGDFLLNAEYFGEIVTMLSAVRTKYTKAPFHNETFYHVTLFSSPSKKLNEFCYDFDFTDEILYTYKETESCELKIRHAYRDCRHLLAHHDRTHPDFISQPPEKLLNYVRCLTDEIEMCDVEVIRVILYDILSFLPNIVTGNLIPYINSIISYVADPNNDPTVRETVWVTGDPHIDSLNYGFETCNFNVQLICISTTKMQINCTGTSLLTGQNVTYLSSVRMKFTKVTELIYYEANQTSFPTTFDNNKVQLNDLYGKLWLEISQSGNFTLIKDHNSRSTILLSKWNTHYMLIVKSSFSDFKTSGVLFDGCPLKYQTTTVDSVNGREVCSSSTQQPGSTDLTINDLYKACVNDIAITGDLSYAQLFKSTFDASVLVKQIDQSLFNSASARRIQIGISLSLIFFSNLINRPFF